MERAPSQSALCEFLLAGDFRLSIEQLQHLLKLPPQQPHLPSLRKLSRCVPSQHPRAQPCAPGPDTPPPPRPESSQDAPRPTIGGLSPAHLDPTHPPQQHLARSPSTPSRRRHSFQPPATKITNRRGRVSWRQQLRE